MAISDDSYGSVDQVAARVPRHTDSGIFTASTRPTLAQLEIIIDEVSAIVNSLLAQNGFTTPITQETAALMLSFFVNEEVAAIVSGINGLGRFGPTAKQVGGEGRFAVIMNDVKEFIAANAVGLERLGATRTYDALAGLAYRDTDERGNATYPLFQRDGYGDSRTDWDS